jgi:hypothetical protein
VPFKGKLSGTDRAVAQRDRAALRSAEQSALELASAADRAAKYQLKTRLSKLTVYTSLPDDKKSEYLKERTEKLAEERFRAKKSG